jgi:hypothetical protein
MQCTGELRACNTQVRSPCAVAGFPRGSEPPNAERGAYANVYAQGFSEPSCSDTDLEPKTWEVGDQLPHAGHLRSKEQLPLLAVEPGVVARGFPLECLEPAQIVNSYATL